MHKNTRLIKDLFAFQSLAHNPAKEYKTKQIKP
jgi:hypothetical protein